MKDLKDLCKPAQKVNLNVKEGPIKKGGWGLQKPVVAQSASLHKALCVLKMSQKVPFLHPDPLTQWSGPENIAKARIDGEGCWALLDSGSTINAVTPEFVQVHSLDFGPLSDLANGTLGIEDFGGVFSQPWVVIIRTQVEGVRGYDKDQVALVIPDSTIFGS